MDIEKVDRVECYLGDLHYPQKNGSGLLTYKVNPECDQQFERKKRQLNLEGTADSLKLWTFAIVVCLMFLLSAISVRQTMIKPKLDWGRAHVNTNKCKAHRGA
ncbi:MAG: hypothetical protein IBX55_11840 [Methyloprofundus sp.]|nr:hypothetical protein [Methyloprofundus sp.]